MAVQIISRKVGRTSTAAAAYRAGVEITDERTGQVHDYTRKAGVVSAEIVMPASSTWMPDRAGLWNAVEAKNKRADAQVAREFEVSLPHELDQEQRRKLAVDFAKEIADRYGIAADVAIHAPGKEGDSRNHHAHILTSTNRVDGEGFGNKARELDLIAHNQSGKVGQANEIDRLRARWAELTNEHLRDAGFDVRVDHRSLEAQGIDREPARHLGPAAAGFERRTGEKSEKRIGWELEAADRLARAQELGQLERERAALSRSIIDLSGDLTSAKAERTRQNTQLQQQAKPIRPESHFSPARVAERERKAQEAVHQVQAPKPQPDRSPQVPQQAEYVLRRTKVAPVEAPQRAIETLSAESAERYTLALKDVTSETLATVPGLLPVQAVREALVEVRKEVEAEANVGQMIDLEKIKRQVLAQPAHQQRLAQADRMEAKANATFEHIAGMGTLKRLMYDTKAMTEEANKLLEAAKLERVQVRNSVNLSPEVQTAEKALGEVEQGRRRVAATLDELKNIESRIARGEAAYKRPDHIYRVPDGVARVVEKARQIAPGTLVGMPAMEVEQMVVRAVDVAWKKPGSQREFDVRVSRFVLPAEQQRQLQEHNQAKQNQRSQGMER